MLPRVGPRHRLQHTSGDRPKRELTSDSQLRWLGPEKGIIHMATGAVLNALWDLRAKRARRVWAGS